MGKIVYLMGKSSTGKDSIYKKLMEDPSLSLHPIVPYTTRPIREGEHEGQEYHFTDEAGFNRLREQGRIVEDRVYHTCHGLWRYFTVDDGSVTSDHIYIMIGTPEAFLKVKTYFGRDKMLPIMIELDDGVRLQRALDREKLQEQPKYEEMCRRFLADSNDFAEEKLLELGPVEHFENDSLECCTEKIRRYIIENTQS